MKIAMLAPAGALAASMVRRLQEDGHHVQAVHYWPGPARGDKNGFSNGQAARIREALRGARAVLHLGWADTDAEALPSHVRRCLLPLSYLLTAADTASKIERVVVLSPASLYGEGSYACPANGTVTPQWRQEEDLRAHRWEHCCPVCGEQLLPQPTAECHPAAPLAGSGLLVYAQERLAAGWALERRIPVVALRYFELYGAELNGPVGRLMARATEGRPVEVSEDGGQTRDFIHVEDVARSVPLALRAPCHELLLLNVASGLQTSVLDFLACLERALDRPLRVRCSGNFNRSDARHLYAQTSQISRLGYHPPLSLREGLEQFVGTLLETGAKLSGRK